MNSFKLKSKFKPTKDQEKAIKALVSGHEKGIDNQVLLGVTGSGKTFTVANVIERLQKPALIISHNKTLAAQLYQEFRDFFPDNSVGFFVSYYDYYQPEAYIPSTDSYIEKDAGINELIEKLRLAATTNLLTRKDTIVIASVSCIYNIGSPKEYRNFVFELSKGMKVQRKQVIDRLIDLQYERGDFGFHRGTFRVRGDAVDVYPSYLDEGIRIELDIDKISAISIFDPVTGKNITNHKSLRTKGSNEPEAQITNYLIFPAKHFITDPTKNKSVFTTIEKDLKNQCDKLKKSGKELEAHRLKQRVTYDIEMIQEVGYVKGIENYSRYFDGRKPGDAPFTLLDYFNVPFKKDWLVFIDESHIAFPQIRGMHAGDLSRKQTLIDYGFRLPSALDNRPLKFEEFMRRIPNFIATSATPADWEISKAYESSAKSNKKSRYAATNSLPKWNTFTHRDVKKNKGVVQQLLRPTGIPDPKVEIRPADNQVSNVIDEIKKRKRKKQRVLVTTLTKITAEDLSEYLKDQGIAVHYLHSDVKTLERTDILDDLRRGKYDCIVGVNLLREGLDLPEVTLVAILDADKEGFLRSEVSLIQTMGRAARHKEGMVILYADTITGSMKRALDEVDRRRKYQLKMNKKYGIKPKSIKKPIRERLVEADEESTVDKVLSLDGKRSLLLPEIDTQGLTPMDKRKLKGKLRREMKLAARDLNFELAAEIRDKIKEIEVATL